jgi:tetratricopeptide (TPR) repeat protein
MPIRRPRGPRPALRHVAFLEAMDALPASAKGRQPLEAAFLTLRLLDNWVWLGAELAEPTGQALTVARDAVEKATSDAESQAALRGIIDAIVMLQEPDTQPLLPRVFAYAGLLEQRGALALAGDVYATVAKYADARAHFDIAYDALMRHAFCLRVEGVLDQAARSYESAGALAARARDRVRVLYSRIGLAKVVWARGNLPAADEALQEVAAEAETLGNTRLHAVALHDCAGMARMRDDLPRAVRLAYESFKRTTDENEKERVLSDLANFLGQTGAFVAARAALTVLESRGRLKETQWHARINLMELGARQGSEPLFEQYRRALENDRLPARLEVNYLRDRGRGYAMFGRFDAARESLTAAAERASTLGMHQVAFESEKLLTDLPALQRQYERARPPAVDAPADIARTIEELVGQTAA